MRDGKLQSLRAVLRERTAQAAANALKNGGSVSSEEIASIRNLSNLCDTLDSTVPAKANRWTPLLLFTLALACASLLLFRRVATTDVEISVKASSAEFRLAKTRYITRPIVVTSLRFSGIRELSDTLCEGLSGGKTPKELTLVAETGTTPGTITLQPVEGMKGVSITIVGGKPSTHWSLAFAGVPQTVKATYEGSLRIEGESCRIDTRIPRTLEATLDRKLSSVTFDLPEPSDVFPSPLLPIDRLAFVRTDIVTLEGVEEHQVSSTLTGGSVFLEELKGKETKLREGDWLEVGVQHGWLQLPAAGGADLAWRWRGSVDALHAGGPESRRDLKPSWLEYLRSQHAIGLLWGSALSLFGLGGAVMRWIKAQAS